MKQLVEVSSNFEYHHVIVSFSLHLIQSDDLPYHGFLFSKKELSEPFSAPAWPGFKLQQVAAEISMPDSLKCSLCFVLNHVPHLI